MKRLPKIASPTGNGTFRAGNGMFRSEVPQAMRQAVKNVVSEMKGKISMREHGKKGKR